MPAAEPGQLLTVMVGLFALMGFVYLALGIMVQARKLAGKDPEDEFVTGKQLSLIINEMKDQFKIICNRFDLHSLDDAKDHKEIREILSIMAQDIAVLKALARRQVDGDCDKES